jgi:superfamily II DNA or RNA helicase
MSFSPKDKVYAVSDPTRVGMVERLGPVHAGQQYYIVFWGGAHGTATVGEDDLRPFQTASQPSEALAAGVFAGPDEFQRLITLQRLVREQPLRNNIYAFNASRTQFFPYQFKPLLKFLESSRNRLLICDEVGLGKTIEAGLLLLELRARQTMRLVLIVCPSNLRAKWRLELRNRFGEDFRILQSKDLQAFFDDYEESPERVSLNGIVSLETLRTPRIESRLEELAIPFDFVVIDEAHHLRNSATSQRKVGVTLADTAQAMVMLTATPVHLGQQNLFSLLNILDSEDFPDFESTEHRFRDNEYIVRAQRLVAQSPPRFVEAAECLQLASTSPWVTRTQLVNSLRERLTRSATDTAALDRRGVFEVQRDLADLNLLGHILTRTRKRDVHEHVAKRRAIALEVEFSPREQELYDTVTALIRKENERAGGTAATAQWRLTTPQRRIASSVQGMVDHYKAAPPLAQVDKPFDNTLDDDADEQDEDALRLRVASLVQTWPASARDAKYDALVAFLRQIPTSNRIDKLVVFATFKHTLRYLGRRLNADGIHALVLSGDTPVDERSTIIEQFRSDPSVRVLLCSRVGSEGLDFQFCSALVNYDLPWNPMDVEQRIGRLDRIGQQADTILIVNFWTKGTIEERILKRLYDRVGIFERSIGDLEAILGDVATFLQQELLNTELSEAESVERVERLARLVEQQRGQIESLEASAAQFVGVDAFFEDEIASIRDRRRFVTGEQLSRFVADFLRENAPRTRFEYDPTTKLGSMAPDAALRDFLRETGHASEAVTIIGSVGSALPITFDAQRAFDARDVEFVNVLHPLVRAIATKYKDDGAPIVAYHLALSTNRLPQGFYYFFVFRLRVTSARAYNSLEAVFIREDLSEAVDSFGAEALLGEIVERGEAPIGPVDVCAETLRAAAYAGESFLLDRMTRIRDSEATTNDAFVDQRIASLSEHYRKMIRKQRELLKRGTSTGKQERYLRMVRGQLARLESELATKQSQLEALRSVTCEYQELAAGIVEVISAA